MGCPLQIRYQLAQIHFCFPRLEPVRHRCLHASLILGSCHTFEEEIGVALNLFGRSESDRVDSILDDGVASGRKAGNAKCEPSDEIVEFADRYCSVDPTVSFS